MTPSVENTEQDWLGRLVRVLTVFRLLVLFVTLVLLPSTGYTVATGVVGLVAVFFSWLALRHWPRISASLARHPAYLLAEILVSMLMLALTGARSPFLCFTLGTAVMAGAIYGRRGATAFAVIFIELYELIALEGFPTMHAISDVQSVVLVPALYPLAIAAGVAARMVIERGARTEALLRDRSRELAVEHERLTVARELHDSLAKTVEGLAMTAMVLPRRCQRDPGSAAELASALAADAQRAALEARALMTGLRVDNGGGLVAKLEARAEALAVRTSARITVHCLDQVAALGVSDEVQHELVRIFGEAAINAVNHGGADRVRVELLPEHSRECQLVMSICDNGCGVDGEVDLDALRAEGHFGLVGMAERAMSFGGRLVFGSSEEGGLMIDVYVPPVPVPVTGPELDRLEVA